jgi:hypothetical protein
MRRWVSNNKMYFREIGWGGMGWTHLDRARGVVDKSCEHANKPSEIPA